MWMLSLELSFFQAFAFLFSLVFCYHDNMLCNRNFLLPASPTLLFPKVLYWGLVPGTSQVSICNDRSHVVMIMLVASFAESQTGQTSPLWWNWPCPYSYLIFLTACHGSVTCCLFSSLLYSSALSLLSPYACMDVSTWIHTHEEYLVLEYIKHSEVKKHWATRQVVKQENTPC